QEGAWPRFAAAAPGDAIALPTDPGELSLVPSMPRRPARRPGDEAAGDRQRKRLGHGDGSSAGGIQGASPSMSQLNWRRSQARARPGACQIGPNTYSTPSDIERAMPLKGSGSQLPWDSTSRRHAQSTMTKAMVAHAIPARMSTTQWLAR